MPFDNTTRNRLQRLVSACRKLLTEEFDAQLQERYGIFPHEGRVFPLEKIPYLDDEQTRITTLLRERIEHISATEHRSTDRTEEAIRRVLREQAFTVLNRFAALRMAEERGIFQETVGDGLRSKAFQVFETMAHSGLGSAYERYRVFINRVFDEIAVDLGVLFDRFSPYGLLFPREAALLRLFELLNDPEIKSLWREDETIGWIYQYYNDPAERKKMREQSSAPRDSRELAVRNQFFTPRYVVEFLTDNTLGRAWFEMTKGETRLKEQCRYLVRRPNEIFLREGETAPEPANSADEDLSQEELLKQPVHIPHRHLKDPRSIHMLDPACGSMHFGLYSFDLLEVIYDEAWEIAHRSEDTLKSSEAFAPFIAFVTQYAGKTTFLREVPRLIIAHNIHGIDIDPRCAQIAGLSLWLRAQRTWQQQRLQLTDRPRIRRSNIVCAEPMPGEESFLNEFIEAQLSSSPEKHLLGQLVRRVFNAMKLAGEAGSLLKIEKGIAGAVAEAKQKWLASPKLQQGRLFADDIVPSGQKELGLDVTGITDDTFWEKAEERIYAALQAYAEQADHGGGYQRRLFADDAACGFAFIDLCRKRYDVVLMNPPFGLPLDGQMEWLKLQYNNAYVDLYAAMVTRGLELCPQGRLGCITSRSFMVAKTLTDWRQTTFLPRVLVLADLGSPVMDAAVVESCAYVLSSQAALEKIPVTDCRSAKEKGDRLLQIINARAFDHIVDRQAISQIFRGKFLYWVSRRVRALLSCDNSKLGGSVLVAKQGLKTFNDFRFLRLHWEVPAESRLARVWEPITRGGGNELFYSAILSVVLFKNDGEELAAENFKANGQTAQSRQASRFYRLPGATYTWRAESFKVAALPSGVVIGGKGPVVIAKSGFSPLLITGLLNSSVFRAIIELQANANQYESGIVEALPAPKLNAEAIERVESMSREAILSCERLGISVEENTHFPGIVRTEQSLKEMEARYCKLASDLPGHVSKVVDELDAVVSAGLELKDHDLRHLRDAAEISSTVVFDHFGGSIGFNLVSYCVGCCFARWDVRYPTDAGPLPRLPDPFAPLPVCPPGQLQNEQGLPLTEHDVRRLEAAGQWQYPLDITWDGILVDDPGHPLDLEARVHGVLQAIWKDHWEAIEREGCEVLGVNTLRDYFRNPTGFFANHLKRYSKSRRQAPIYWPLSTRSGSYTLWLYYNRLSDQTLYLAVNEFLKPKIAQVEADLARVSANGIAETGRRATFEQLTEFRSELIQFQDELLRVAQLPYRPNLNDGVLITASPLWKFFRLSKWTKDLKACWEALSAGKYDWAHLAYSIWPERVEKVCETDRSVAIAHNLEYLCKIAVGKSGKKRTRVSPEEPPQGDT